MLLLPWLQGRDQALQAMSVFLWRFKTLFPGGTLDIGGMTPAAAQSLAAIALHQVRPPQPDCSRTACEPAAALALAAISPHQVTPCSASLLKNRASACNVPHTRPAG